MPKATHRLSRLDPAFQIRVHLRSLLSLRYPSGLFAAARTQSPTGYEKSWVRDNFYESMAFFELGRYSVCRKTLRSLLKIFTKHENKIDAAIREKPVHKMDYLHARYHPETFDEFWEDWGNKQNDSIGAVLFYVGKMTSTPEAKFSLTRAQKRIVQKIVRYLASIRYWEDQDSGMWEENEELHASSIAACVAGLKSIRQIPGLMVPDEIIFKGEQALLALLPRESPSKFVDLALLSVVWPYNQADPKIAQAIVENVKYHLVRKHGLIRYKGDYYYNKNPDGKSEEAEWSMGFSWLSILYRQLANDRKSNDFLKKAFSTINAQNEIPELYFSNSEEHNDNSPLGWSESLFIIALSHFLKKYSNEKKSPKTP